MHRIEIFLRTIDEINRNATLLPNITLGCDIRDSCWYPPVALEQSIDFIKNSIASMEQINRTKSREASGVCSQKRESPIAGLIGPGSSTVTVQVRRFLHSAVSYIYSMFQKTCTYYFAKDSCHFTVCCFCYISVGETDHIVSKNFIIN